MYMHKEDLALNNLQWLMCHKTQLNTLPRKSDLITIKAVLQLKVIPIILFILTRMMILIQCCLYISVRNPVNMLPLVFAHPFWPNTVYDGCKLKERRSFII